MMLAREPPGHRKPSPRARDNENTAGGDGTIRASQGGLARHGKREEEERKSKNLRGGGEKVQPV